MRKWNLNVLHLSHTDIGYTDTQERIITNQVTYLHEIVAKYLEQPKKFETFKYICESFFIVEKFLSKATENEKKIFAEMISKGIIGLSATFLNISELANSNLYGAILKRISKICSEYNWKINSSVTNDINGFSLGYAVEMQKAGIENMFFGLHTHHGMFPCFKKQAPFYWEVEPGKKILTWVGEQYLVGNELGLVDGHIGGYVLHLNGLETKKPAEVAEQVKQSVIRIKEYLKELEKSGYEHSTVPITVLGDGGDNSQWNLDIVDRLELINKELEGQNISLEMTTLETFFKNIRDENKPIPTYTGDWPDWWTDGTGSTPNGTRIFRQAQRNYEVIKKLNIVSELQDELEEMLMMYAEHTWGAWSSIENPFAFWTQEISSIKASYAARALSLSTQIIDQYTKRKTVHRPTLSNEVQIDFEVPHKANVSLCLNLNNYLTPAEKDNFANGFEVIQGGKKVASFVSMQYYMQIPQPQIYAVVDLSKNTSIKIIATPSDKKHKITWQTDIMGADRITDVYNPLTNDEVVVNDKTIENDFLKIIWNENHIVSVFSKTQKIELLDQTKEGLFTPLYEISNIPYQFEQMNLQRRWTGRNRKRNEFSRHIGKIKSVNVVSDQKEFVSVEFNYEIKGTKYYKLILNISNKARMIDATIQIIKDIEWSIENLYISLPFAKESSKVLFDKGKLYEIWKEQLPGTCIDYYSVHDGIEIKENGKTSALISTPDNNLFWTGSLDYQKRFLAHDTRNTQRPSLYAWVMNNAWETNFNADLSGFHEFKFTIHLPEGESNSQDNLKVMNNAFLIKRKD